MLCIDNISKIHKVSEMFKMYKIVLNYGKAKKLPRVEVVQLTLHLHCIVYYCLIVYN